MVYKSINLLKDKVSIDYIKQHFSQESTEKIANHLGMTSYTVRKIAKENHVHKSTVYLEKLAKEMQQKRLDWYQASIPVFKPSYLQEQLIFGSLLGDGYISRGAKRSINCHYQEHFGENQLDYRKWKLKMLEGLSFSINGNYLRSKSHPYFTDLRSNLYHDGTKTLNKHFIKKCNHIIFLASLYLDDGSLVITHVYNKKKQIVYCQPSIILYSLNFSHEENALLANHLNETFGTNFVVSGHPDGKGYLLKINKEREVRFMLNLIKPHTKNIVTMLYKTDLDEKINLQSTRIKQKYGQDIKIVASSSNRMKLYSKKEINQMINMKLNKCTDQMIADQLGRSYWSVVYKLRELRKVGASTIDN